MLRKRSDGYHDIDSIFYPVPLKDVLEIITIHGTQPALSIYGMPVQGEAADNICSKAWHLLKKDFPDLPAVHIHLLKNIPMGAGLGGGSADGTFMLQLLNDQFVLGISSDRLMEYALRLGSDCPFFINNQPAHATGRGEKLIPVQLDLAGLQLVLVHPGIHVNTGWAFSQLRLPDQPLPTLVAEAIAKPVTAWKQLLVNDFEQPVFEKYPEILDIRETLYQKGAVYASMSGSGSTVFGLFEKEKNLTGGLPAHCTVIRL